MKTIRMRKSGKLITANDHKARLLMRMKVAYQEPPVVKASVVIDDALDRGEEPEICGVSEVEACENVEHKQGKKASKRRYRRRDMEAEDNCANSPDLN